MKRPVPKASIACLACSLCLCTIVARANPYPLLKNSNFAGDISTNPADIGDNWVATATVVQPQPPLSVSEITQSDHDPLDPPDTPRTVSFLVDPFALGGTNLSLEQRISQLDPGAYRLSFNFVLYSTGAGTPESDFFDVLLNGSVQTVADNSGKGSASWYLVDSFETTPYSLTFTLGHTESDFDLGFRLYRDAPCEVDTTVTLNHVELSPVAASVPIPGAAVLGAIGLSLAGWRLKRRTP
jgi:hypothetical protein